MTDSPADTPSFHDDYPQLPGFDALMQVTVPRRVTLEEGDLASLDQLSEILIHIRHLATARPQGALAQIEILAGAMAKTPRLLAEGVANGARQTLVLERLAGARALALAAAPRGGAARSVRAVIDAHFQCPNAGNEPAISGVLQRESTKDAGP
ncbi:hypothetical protein RHOFW510R12_00525 [Rhodanobacter sp. FW510-R12]|uniref:hypothetical protein n=1 Tax=Rhodanobacter thiooxydans TaxID=416169 RepID=UPI00091B1CB8|nr:hypothetical protein [Rhodanobacter thiooxydans]UJJ56726.1 hypothetical protein LRK53_19140 [Rhodanobacter thiooxydans]